MQGVSTSDRLRIRREVECERSEVRLLAGRTLCVRARLVRGCFFRRHAIIRSFGWLRGVALQRARRLPLRVCGPDALEGELSPDLLID
jgi:hypothetical protein